MKQTAVEWYENKINALFDKYENKEISESEFLIMKHNLFYPAKEKEKEQIEDAHIEGQRVFDDYPHTEWTNHQAEEYYNKTFKNK